MCRKRRASANSSCGGGRTRVVCLGVVCALLIIVLSVALVFHLNHHQQSRTLDTESTARTVSSVVQPGGDFAKKQQCTFQAGEIAIRIPQLNFPLVTVLAKSDSSKDSKRFQASMLKITKKLADSFRVANTSAEKIDSLSTQVDDQLTHVYRSLDAYSNSNRLFESVQQPLRNVAESAKKIAHHFLSAAKKFEQLFHLMKVVVNGSVGKKLVNLENAIHVVEGHLHSSTHGRRELEKAIQSLTNSSLEAALRLQRDNAELDSASHEWQSLKMRSDSVNCFDSWEWNWWPITYTSTSVCFGRPSDEEWANSNARLERAKWKRNCSTIELDNMQEQIKKWNEVDDELSAAIERLVGNKEHLSRKLLALFNGTSSDSLVQMERETCKMTTGLTRVYNEAADFFLDMSSRISDNLAVLEPTVLDNVAGISRPMPSDAFHELRSNLKKTISEALDHDAIIAEWISRHNHVFRVQMKKLKRMKAQKNTISSDTLVKLLEHTRKSHLKLNKSADQNWQKCDALSIE